jgi:hypothetical protein
MRAHVPAQILARVKVAEEKASRTGRLTLWQYTLRCWPPRLSLDEWEIFAAAQQDALAAGDDANPSSWFLSIETDPGTGVVTINAGDKP